VLARPFHRRRRSAAPVPPITQHHALRRASRAPGRCASGRLPREGSRIWSHPAAAARARRALLLPGGRRPGAGEARRVTGERDPGTTWWWRPRARRWRMRRTGRSPPPPVARARARRGAVTYPWDRARWWARSVRNVRVHKDNTW